MILSLDHLMIKDHHGNQAGPLLQTSALGFREPFVDLELEAEG